MALDIALGILAAPAIAVAFWLASEIVAALLNEVFEAWWFWLPCAALFIFHYW